MSTSDSIPAGSKVARIKRAVGYCHGPDCEDYAKGTFLLNHGDTFYCPRCRQLGLMVRETTKMVNDSRIFREVRIEYNYEPTTGHYRELAVVMDTSVKGEANCFIVYSPLIRTEKRALKVAEGLLATLQREQWIPAKDDEGIPAHGEVIMDLSKPRIDFITDCQELSRSLSKSSLSRGEPCPSTTT